MKIRVSLENFIERSNKIHNNKYEYSKILFIKDTNQIVEIICPLHNIFEQRISSHLSGYGCKECGNQKQRGTKEEFIKNSKKVHGDEYDYSKVDYFNSYTKVEIICLKHGSYLQTPECHLSKSGCPACGKVKRVSFEDFVRRSKEIHGNKYDYSKVIWKNISSKIEIECDKKHLFRQRPYDHLNKHGCPFCRHIVSFKEDKWLDEQGIPRDPKNRQVKLSLQDGTKVLVDGFIPETKTVYEFLGDFFHGNPKVYDLKNINPLVKKTFKFLFEKTEKRIKNLEKNGYNVIYIWENDFNTTSSMNKILEIR